MTTVYWAGGEDTSYSALTGVAVSTTTTYFRSSYARACIHMGGGSTTTTFPLANNAASPIWGPSSSFWVHAMCYNDASANTTANAILLAVADSSGVGRILVRGTGTSGQLKISTRNAAGTITDLVTSASGAMPAATSGGPIAVDLFVNYSTSGQCALYVNGTNIADTGTGVNVTTDSATQLAQVFFGAAYNTGLMDYGWSEVLVQDTSTLGCAVWTLAPAAAGNTQSWTPNTVGNINPTAINDSNYISTTSDNALSEWTTNYTAPSGTWAVEALVQEARVVIGTSGPQHFEWLVRTTDGSDHTQGSVGPSTSFSNFNGAVNGGVWPTNPHTGAAWALSDFSTGFNIGIESLA